MIRVASNNTRRWGRRGRRGGKGTVEHSGGFRGYGTWTNKVAGNELGTWSNKGMRMGAGGRRNLLAWRAVTTSLAGCAH